MNPFAAMLAWLRRDRITPLLIIDDDPIVRLHGEKLAAALRPFSQMPVPDGYPAIRERLAHAGDMPCLDMPRRRPWPSPVPDPCGCVWWRNYSDVLMPVWDPCPQHEAEAADWQLWGAQLQADQ